MLSFQSCNKEIDTIGQEVGKINSTATHPIVQQVEGFYNTVKSVKNGATSSQTFSPDSLSWYLEATYNFKAVNQDEDIVPINKTFEISVPLTPTQKVTANQASVAFYQVKDSISKLINDLKLSDKTLRMFDSKIISISPGSVSLGFHVSVAEHNSSLPFTLCGSESANPSNLGYLVHSVNSNDFEGTNVYEDLGAHVGPLWTYYNGRVSLNMTTRMATTSTFDNTLPGAALTIRNQGIKKYFNCQKRPKNWYYNIELAFYEGEMTTPNHQYTTLGISTVDNLDLYRAARLYESGSTNDDYENFPSSVDNGKHLKEFLTRPMVQFYINKTPGIFAAQIPTSKTFYDFQIYGEQSICKCVNPDLSYYGYPFNSLGFTYFIWYADALPVIAGTSGIGIFEL